MNLLLFVCQLIDYCSKGNRTGEREHYLLLLPGIITLVFHIFTWKNEASKLRYSDVIAHMGRRTSTYKDIDMTEKITVTYTLSINKSF